MSSVGVRAWLAVQPLPCSLLPSHLLQTLCTGPSRSEHKYHWPGILLATLVLTLLTQAAIHMCAAAVHAGSPVGRELTAVHAAVDGCTLMPSEHLTRPPPHPQTPSTTPPSRQGCDGSWPRTAAAPAGAAGASRPEPGGAAHGVPHLQDAAHPFCQHHRLPRGPGHIHP